MHDLLKLLNVCQWQRGDTCTANLDGTRASAVPAYVLNVDVPTRRLKVMHGDGHSCWVYMEWCHKGNAS